MDMVAFSVGNIIFLQPEGTEESAKNDTRRVAVSAKFVAYMERWCNETPYNNNARLCQGYLIKTHRAANTVWCIATRK